MRITESDILKASILIVDDQVVNVALLSQMLQDSDYTQVSSTQNAYEVAALHAKNNYDLILLDLQMPGLNGFQVMEKLQKNDGETYLPVLVITAEPGHKLRALQSGAKDFVSKPFDLLEVRTRIRNMLEVRLLYKQLEQKVRERTAQLEASEARYRSLTELASDWYWEQDERGQFTKISGPVLEMLGIQAGGHTENQPSEQHDGWDESQRVLLRTHIAERRPFLDFVFKRANADGSTQIFQVSGEPMFDPASRFVGYRGVGAELLPAN